MYSIQVSNSPYRASWQCNIANCVNLKIISVGLLHICCKCDRQTYIHTYIIYIATESWIKRIWGADAGCALFDILKWWCTDVKLTFMCIIETETKNGKLKLNENKNTKYVKTKMKLKLNWKLKTKTTTKTKM